METLLVDSEIAPEFWKEIAHSLTEKKVEIQIRASNEAFSRLSALDYKPLRRAS
jgi:gamma-glutamyl phosphate reductase